MPEPTSASSRFFVLSALGTDRPGIVAEVTEFVNQCGGNVEESRMAILGGEFGLLMLVSAAADAMGRFESELAEVEKHSGLELRLKPTESPESHRKSGALPYKVRTYAADHKGIIHAISRAIANLDVNIVSAATSSYPAPITGTPLFQMEMEIDVPQGLGLPQLRAVLDEVAVAEDADIEITFDESVH